jgi:DNA-binding transcriptional MerR regulator
MNTRDAAKLLEVTPRTLQSYARNGIVPCRVIEHKSRNTYLFDREQLIAFKRGEAPEASNDGEFSMNLSALGE